MFRSKAKRYRQPNPAGLWDRTMEQYLRDAFKKIAHVTGH